MTPDKAIDLAAAIVGGKGALCKALNLNRQAIHNWKRHKIPLTRAIEIEKLTNFEVTREMLRPDFFNGN